LFKNPVTKNTNNKDHNKKNSTINNKRSESEVRNALLQWAIAVNPATKANNRFHNNSSMDNAQTL
jgi:hypothetical protein